MAIIPIYAEFKKHLSEASTLSDSILLRLSLKRTFSEILTLTDDLEAKPLKLLLESITLQDSISRITNKVITENLLVIDGVIIKRVAPGAKFEKITLTDILIKKTLRTLSEDVGLSDDLEINYLIKRLIEIPLIKPTITSISNVAPVIDVITNVVPKINVINVP